MELFNFPHKQIRAAVIRQYMAENGFVKAVCFSCGNASRALREAGVDTLDISPAGDLSPGRWFTQAEIQRTFPGMFDATSGHLPAELMTRIAGAFRAHLGPISGHIYLPTGSGETLIELKMAYPELIITAVYGLDKATEYSTQAPLNALVRALASDIIFLHNTEGGATDGKRQTAKRD